MQNMHFIILTLILFSLCVTTSKTHADRREEGNLVIEDIPEIPESISSRIAQYQNTRSASVQDWMPGGGMLIATRFAETTQIHSVEHPGGARRQITYFDEPVYGASMCPDASVNGFLFVKDIGGNEYYQIFFFDFAAGQHTMLTDGVSRHGSVLWSNKGDRFVYHSTKRNDRDYDLYVCDICHPHDAAMILENEGLCAAVDWSPDDQKLLVLNYISVNESYYSILDIETGRLDRINPSDEKISYGSAMWAKDGRGIFITSDEGSEFRRLMYYDIASRSFTVITKDIPWDVQSIDITERGDRLAFTVNDDGMGKLYMLDTPSMNYKQVPGIPSGQVYGLLFHTDGDRLAMGINTARTPGDIYVLNLENDSLERWTYSEVGGLNSESFVSPELIHYETFDSVDGKPRMIPAFYYKPDKGNGPFPVLIDIHGGPEGQYLPYFSSMAQYYVNELGTAVLAPNVRGSAGYGKSYLLLDNGFKREDSVRDIGKLLDWIDKQPELDSSRIAVIGGSYGGYMVLSTMTHFNDRLACGIEIVGISNFVTFLENTKEYRRNLRRQEYGDERDPDMRKFLLQISPTTNVHKITKPMFISQGLNDPRVPASESEQIVKVIRKNGGTVWYLLAKDEGHGFSKKSNRDYYNNAVALFLEMYLLKR